MNKHLLRIVSLLLIPCLVAGPATAGSLARASDYALSPASQAQTPVFNQQAIVPSSFISAKTAPLATPHLIKGITAALVLRHEFVPNAHGLRWNYRGIAVWGLVLGAALVGGISIARRRLSQRQSPQRKALEDVSRALATRLNLKESVVRDILSQGPQGIRLEDLRYDQKLQQWGVPLQKTLELLIGRLPENSTEFNVYPQPNYQIALNVKTKGTITLGKVIGTNHWIILGSLSSRLDFFSKDSIKINPQIRFQDRLNRADYVFLERDHEEETEQAKVRPASGKSHPIRNFTILVTFLMVSFKPLFAQMATWVGTNVLLGGTVIAVLTTGVLAAWGVWALISHVLKLSTKALEMGQVGGGGSGPTMSKANITQDEPPEDRISAQKLMAWLIAPALVMLQLLGYTVHSDAQTITATDPSTPPAKTIRVLIAPQRIAVWKANLQVWKLMGMIQTARENKPYDTQTIHQSLEDLKEPLAQGLISAADLEKVKKLLEVGVYVPAFEKDPTTRERVINDLQKTADELSELMVDPETLQAYKALPENAAVPVLGRPKRLNKEQLWTLIKKRTVIFKEGYFIGPPLSVSGGSQAADVEGGINRRSLAGDSAQNDFVLPHQVVIHIPRGAISRALTWIIAPIVVFASSLILDHSKAAYMEPSLKKPGMVETAIRTAPLKDTKPIVSYSIRDTQLSALGRRYSPLDPDLVYVVRKKESQLDPDAVSGKGAMGLMQLMPATAEDVAERIGLTDYDITDPETNVRLGYRYLYELYLRYDGNIVETLAAYNAGPNVVEQWMGALALQGKSILEIDDIPYAETRKYVREVLSAYDTVCAFRALPDGQIVEPVGPPRYQHLSKDQLRALIEKNAVVYVKEEGVFVIPVSGSSGKDDAKPKDQSAAAPENETGPGVSPSMPNRDSSLATPPANPILLYPSEKQTSALEQSRAELNQRFGPWTPDEGRQKVSQIILQVHQAWSPGVYFNARDVILTRLLITGFPHGMVFQELARRMGGGDASVLSMAKMAAEGKFHTNASKDVLTLLSRSNGQQIWLKNISNQDLFASISFGPIWFRFIRKLLVNYDQSSPVDRHAILQRLDDARQTIALVSQWDFLNRFPGASGIQLLRGNGFEYFKNPTSQVYDLTFTRSSNDALASCEPGGAVVVADIPWSSIQDTRWVLSELEPYRPVFRIRGRVRFQHHFSIDKTFDSLAAWLEFRQTYNQALRQNAHLETRVPEYPDRYTEKVWLQRAALAEFRKIGGREEYVGHPVINVFVQAVNRAIQQSPDLLAALPKARRLVKRAGETPKKELAKYLQTQFRPSANPNPISKGRKPSPQKMKALRQRVQTAVDLLSQKEVANYSGVSAMTLSIFLGGRGTIQPRTAWQLSAFVARLDRQPEMLDPFKNSRPLQAEEQEFLKRILISAMQNYRAEVIAVAAHAGAQLIRWGAKGDPRVRKGQADTALAGVAQMDDQAPNPWPGGELLMSPARLADVSAQLQDSVKRWGWARLEEFLPDGISAWTAKAIAAQRRSFSDTMGDQIVEAMALMEKNENSITRIQKPRLRGKRLSAAGAASFITRLNKAIKKFGPAAVARASTVTTSQIRFLTIADFVYIYAKTRDLIEDGIYKLESGDHASLLGRGPNLNEEDKSTILKQLASRIAIFGREAVAQQAGIPKSTIDNLMQGKASLSQRTREQLVQGMEKLQGASLDIVRKRGGNLPQDDIERVRKTLQAAVNQLGIKTIRAAGHFPRKYLERFLAGSHGITLVKKYQVLKAIRVAKSASADVTLNALPSEPTSLSVGSVSSQGKQVNDTVAQIDPKTKIMGVAIAALLIPLALFAGHGSGTDSIQTASIGAGWGGMGLLISGLLPFVLMALGGGDRRVDKIPSKDNVENQAAAHELTEKIKKALGRVYSDERIGQLMSIVNLVNDKRDLSQALRASNLPQEDQDWWLNELKTRTLYDLLRPFYVLPTNENFLANWNSSSVQSILLPVLFAVGLVLKHFFPLVGSSNLTAASMGTGGILGLISSLLLGSFVLSFAHLSDNPNEEPAEQKTAEPTSSSESPVSASRPADAAALPKTRISFLSFMTILTTLILVSCGILELSGADVSSVGFIDSFRDWVHSNGWLDPRIGYPDLFAVVQLVSAIVIFYLSFYSLHEGEHAAALKQYGIRPHRYSYNETGPILEDNDKFDRLPPRAHIWFDLRPAVMHGLMAIFSFSVIWLAGIILGDVADLFAVVFLWWGLFHLLFAIRYSLPIGKGSDGWQAYQTLKALWKNRQTASNKNAPAAAQIDNKTKLLGIAIGALLIPLVLLEGGGNLVKASFNFWPFILGSALLPFIVEPLQRIVDRHPTMHPLKTLLCSA